jgi:hypothetical protein
VQRDEKHSALVAERLAKKAPRATTVTLKEDIDKLASINMKLETHITLPRAAVVGKVVQI